MNKEFPLDGPQSVFNFYHNFVKAWSNIIQGYYVLKLKYYLTIFFLTYR